MSHKPYDKFEFILPPRTSAKAPFDSSPVIQAWMKMPDAIAQYKLNGSRNLIFISPEDKIELWNRHREQHRNYVVPEALKAKIRALKYPRGKWNVIDSELLHFKTPNIKNTIYLFDVLVWNGEYLLGDTYTQRYALVQQLGNSEQFPLDKTSIEGMIYTAQNLAPDLWAGAWLAAAPNVAVEGLVLKRMGPVGRLQFAGSTEYNNGGFQCRVRKPFKNAQF